MGEFTQLGNTVLETDLDKLAYNVQSMKRYAKTGLIAMARGGRVLK